jgi:hypothetical protein
MQPLSPLSRCARICGLTAQEMIVGASPRPEHELLAARYFHSSTVGKATMRTAMVAAIRAALQASQPRSAAEFLVALRMMLGKRRGRSGAARRRSRRCFYGSRSPVQAFGGTPREERLAASAEIVILAERRTALASSRAWG